MRRPRTSAPSRLHRQEGIALIVTLMVLMLVSVLMVGFVTAIVADQRASGLDRDQTQAYAAAHAGLEQLTSDLSGLFNADFSPSALADRHADGDAAGAHGLRVHRTRRWQRLRHWVHTGCGGESGAGGPATAARFPLVRTRAFEGLSRLTTSP